MAEDLKSTLFKRTDLPDLTGKIQSVGVGLTAGEHAALQAIGEAVGELLGSQPVPKNAIMRHAIHSFLLDYYTGKITAEDLAQAFTVPPKPKAKYSPSR